VDAADSIMEISAEERASFDVVLAAVRRPWGREGELLVELHTDWPEIRFAAGLWLTLFKRDRRGLRMRSAGLRYVSAGALLRLEGVGSISEAKRCAPSTIVGNSRELGVPESGAVTFAELVGVTVLDRRRGELGTVARIDESPGAPLLVVIDPLSAAEYLIPYAAGSSPVLDRARRTLEVTTPTGLLDANQAIEVKPRASRERA
jgi:16S rRNA processing protein RimM